MGIMSESENKEITKPKKIIQDDDLLMKPFSLGWTREVVMRVITKNRAPNCDIYYFSPSKKRIRSLTELRNILTDGLSPECFSFKREPLGLSPDFETIRDAKLRGKKFERFQNTLKKSENFSNNTQVNNDNDNDNENEIEKMKSESGNEISKEENETKENDEKEMKNSETKENNLESQSETRPKRIIKTDEKASKEINNFNTKKKTKRKTVKPSTPVKLSMRQRKIVLKKIMNAKQTKQVKMAASKKILKKIVTNMAKTPKKKLPTKRNKKETPLKNKKNIKVKSKEDKKNVKNNLTKVKNETQNESENSENDKKCLTRDLKSIVKKNIGKYREMREKQKLGAVKNQMRNSTRKAISSTRSRSEPISKNKLFYLKPLEKGWRRELVYRSNCARAGQRADVYYFHPNGKKLRSCREIAENLTHGLSIDCFTFRKEPIGCGEPSEVVRNARFIQKN